MTDVALRVIAAGCVALLCCAACSTDTPLNSLEGSPDRGYNCVPVEDGLASIAIEGVTNTGSSSVTVDHVRLDPSGATHVESWFVTDWDWAGGVYSGTFPEHPADARTTVGPGKAALLAMTLRRDTASRDVQGPHAVHVQYSDDDGDRGQLEMGFGVLVLPAGETCDDKYLNLDFPAEDRRVFCAPFSSALTWLLPG